MSPADAARAVPAPKHDPRNDDERLPDRLDFLHSSLAPQTQSAIRLILGVEIGATGALALLTGAGELGSIEDMPVLADGPAGRHTVNPALLAEFVYENREPAR